MIHETCDEYVLSNQLGDTKLFNPRAYSPIWKAHRWSARCGPVGFVFPAADWLTNSDVELLPPALIRTVFASSNIKCAAASLGWFGTIGTARILLLYLKF